LDGARGRSQSVINSPVIVGIVNSKILYSIYYSLVFSLRGRVGRNQSPFM